MVPRVLQHIDQHMPNVARRPRRAHMIPVGKYPSSSPHHPVQPFRDPYTHPFHPSRQRPRVPGLGHEVKVPRLDGEVDEAEAEAVAARLKRGAKHRALRPRSKVVKAPDRTQCHVQNVPRCHPRTPGVRHARLPAAWPPGPRAPATPARAARQHQLRSRRDRSPPGAAAAGRSQTRGSSRHLNMANVYRHEPCGKQIPHAHRSAPAVGRGGATVGARGVGSGEGARGGGRGARGGGRGAWGADARP
jgi:hypothetical protein